MNDEATELRALIREFRTALAWRERGGTYAASGVQGANLPEQEVDEVTRSASRPALTVAEMSPPVAIAVTPPANDSATDTTPRASAASSLRQIREELGDCQRCKLAETRNQIVFGVGSEHAPLMFVGEAPGADEDRLGEPFVGKAGKLLDRMIVAMGWTRESVYIANVLKCRPPGNRDPHAEEVSECEPFLAQQIAAVAPRIIVTLGKPAAHLLLNSRAPISALRGRFQEFRGIPVMPTFHPAYLLRSPEYKADTWNDLKLVIAELARLGVESPRAPKT